MLLSESIQKGDVILIHFSCHGQQIEDLSGDEVDGLNEAIVCYGAPMDFTDGYKGSSMYWTMNLEIGF
ncbi:MAG: hypothetical protein ACI9DJ_002399 [Algoriphagus sp.]|jgi:hypothetical protein